MRPEYMHGVACCSAHHRDGWLDDDIIEAHLPNQEASVMRSRPRIRAKSCIALRLAGGCFRQ